MRAEPLRALRPISPPPKPARKGAEAQESAKGRQGPGSRRRRGVSGPPKNRKFGFWGLGLLGLGFRVYRGLGFRGLGFGGSGTFLANR